MISFIHGELFYTYTLRNSRCFFFRVVLKTKGVGNWLIVLNLRKRNSNGEGGGEETCFLLRIKE